MLLNRYNGTALGATFRFTPVYRHAAAWIKWFRPTVGVTLRKSKVLLIEDEKIDAIGVGRVLKELYPSVLLEVLTTGEHALEWIGRFRQDGEIIALILMDMTLPRLEGLELLPQIRKNPNLVHTPVVVLSGNDSQAAVQNAYRSGACAYIVKRSELAEMRRILGHMFSFWLDANLLSGADALPA